jgi:transglutaminase-like putative cysteine protease
LFLLSGAIVPAFADDAPDWLRRASLIQLPKFDKKVSAVVLVDDSSMTVGEDGRLTTVSTYAVRILNREGRDEAVASVGYETDIGKVRDFRAWLITPSGLAKSYGKDEVIDLTDSNDVYDESRLKKIVASSDAEPGAVFGYQTTTETRPYFYQSTWYFQAGAPVVSSRLTLTLPTGWRANSVTFNHSDVTPATNGTTYTWELRDLPPLEWEPASPTFTNLAPRLAVNYSPTEAVKNPGVRSFESWSDVSRWYSELSEVQATPDERIAAKARELTAAAKTELDKIRAIGQYVQKIQYISVQIGVGRWRPHAASQIMAKSYGDCKDKANLMRAMLKSLNIQSYPVLIFAGDSTYVREAWVSPGQFNHCIIAVKVSDETKAPTVINLPTVGRLLIFDATDDATPVGDLPEKEQGSFALIAAGDSGALVKMPETPSESNSVERQIAATLSAEGALTATVNERAIGQRAVAYRREFNDSSRPEYVKLIEGWVTSGATAARVSKVEPTDRSSEGRFDLEVDFYAGAYGQLMQQRLLVFKPALVSRRESLFLTEAVRVHPIVLNSRAFTETLHLKLPAGFEVDELPDPLKLDASFGFYNTTYAVKDGELIFTRTLAQRAGTIPVAQYQSVRSFFEKIRAAEQSPVVLVRK